MSVQNVRDAIERFLADSTPQVLCIRGAWGTGKIYTWKDVATQRRKVPGGIALSQYAYISLFGLNTIQEIKLDILQSTVASTQIGQLITAETLRERFDSAEGPAKRAFLWAARGIMGNRFDSLVAALSMTTAKQIIVFDDLERKGDKLNNSDVFGLTSYLTEERKCKVVLLLNELQLKPEDKAVFDSYLEKVVDISLRFDPTKEEIARIAIEETDMVADLVRNNVIHLGITNIRVIRKVLGMVKELAPLVSDYSCVVLENAAAIITLFGWSYLQPHNAPKLEYLKRVHTFSPQKDDADLDLQWRDLLASYNFTHASDFDLALLEGIEKGYFEKDKIEKHASVLHNADARNKVEKEMRSIWDDMHYSFVKPVDQVLDRFYESYMRNIEYQSMGDMVIFERLFRELGDPRSDDFVERYIAVNHDRPDALDISRLERMGEELTDKVREKILAAAASQSAALTNDEVVFRLAKLGFEDEYLELAAAMPVSEYIRILKSYEGAQQSDIQNAFRQYLRVGTSDSRPAMIMHKAGKALREIAKESLINRRRAMRLGLIQRLEAEEKAERKLLAAEQDARKASTTEHGREDE